MQRPIDHHTALIFTMVLIAAAEGDMTDEELERIGLFVRFLPVFRDFDKERLPDVGRACAELLRREDGLDLALDMIGEALPSPLCETAYTLACDIAAADDHIAEEELEMLKILRQRLRVDRLVSAAIERATYARYALPVRS